LSLAVFGVFVGVYAIFKFAPLDKTERTFLVIAIVLLALITGGYYAWKAWTEKQHNQQFGGEIAQHTSATPRGLSDPGQRARLDDMRKKFQSGVDAYKSRGKDLYKLPWYVIVGEPGSGKTEAIRHSNVGFPPGMQDEFQGVGGTINMNWWFTNHAVLLDTAGRLMFEEVKPGETSEWKEFLTLLRKNRPNCPINGLFLVIPSDSLIRDSADEIQKKAGKIAQQLDVIQRALDVRFPVFVVVTKCDKINGFREFFDGLTDPQLQHQMMGWSNPDPLDDPFKPELVDKYLDQVAARLRRRRLGLLRDPVPENDQGRRADEVDSLYALPHSLETLSSRLRRYLETIFIAGEWSAKPLFLRGIYFSSSMREGAALDAELAQAIGVGVDELPEGKVWERERAYFLRDLFTEKVFRERGLVTRATNTKRMLRGQQIALYTFGFVSLALFCTVAWFAMGNIRGGVKDQRNYWKEVSDKGWDNKFWKESIVPMNGDGTFTATLSTNTLLVEGKVVTLGEFQARLVELAQKPLARNFIFPGVADKYNQNSHRAQRIVFEAGIVRPLIEATRQKMQRDLSDPVATPHEPDALATLIKLEADVLSRGTTPTNGAVSPDMATNFLGSLESYLFGKDLQVDSNLVAVMAWTYSTNDTSKNSWAPLRLSGRQGSTNNLAVNTGIYAGLELFVRNATNDLQNHLSQWDQIVSLRDSLRSFANSEKTLLTAAKSGLDDNFRKDEEALQKSGNDMDDALKKATNQGLFTGGTSLSAAHHRFLESIQANVAGAFIRIRSVNDVALAANKDCPLFKDIKARLDSMQNVLINRASELQAAGDEKEFQALDEICLVNNGYRKRVDLYGYVESLLGTNPFSGVLIGTKGEPLEKFLSASMEAVRKQAVNCSGSSSNTLAEILAYQTNLVEKTLSDRFFSTYLAKARDEIGTGFPLLASLSLKMDADRFTRAGAQLKLISEDLNSQVFRQRAPQDSRWRTFVENVNQREAVAKALLGDEGTLGACNISLAASTSDDGWQSSWRDLKLVSDGVTGEDVRTGADVDQPLGQPLIRQKLELLLIREIHSPKPETFPTLGTEEWGPLEWIHKYKGEKEKTNPQIWLVKLPISAPGTKGWIRLKLKFERALPDLDKWPGADR
jgi:hypothetical protein